MTGFLPIYAADKAGQRLADIFPNVEPLGPHRLGAAEYGLNLDYFVVVLATHGTPVAYTRTARTRGWGVVVKSN